MRIGVYLILLVLIGLLIADAYYIKDLYAAPAESVSYNIQNLNSVLSELKEMQRRAKHEAALLLIHDAQKIHGEHWNLLLARAQSLIEMDSVKTAIIELNRVLELQPQNQEALSMRARCLRDDHRIDDALKDIHLLLATNSLHEEALFLQGTIQFARTQFMEAITSFTQSLVTNPKSLSALYNRAQCYAQLNDYTKARADMLTAVDLSDDEKFKETAIGILRQWQDK